MTKPTFGELRELTIATRMTPEAVWAAVEHHAEAASRLAVRPVFRIARRGPRFLVEETSKGLHGPAAVCRVERSDAGAVIHVKLEYRPDALTSMLTATVVFGLGVTALLSAGQVPAALLLGSATAGWLPASIYVGQRSYARELEVWLSALFPPPVTLGTGPYRGSLPAAVPTTTR